MFIAGKEIYLKEGDHDPAFCNIARDPYPITDGDKKKNTLCIRIFFSARHSARRTRHPPRRTR